MDYTVDHGPDHFVVKFPDGTSETYRRVSPTVFRREGASGAYFEVPGSDVRPPDAPPVSLKFVAAPVVGESPWATAVRELRTEIACWEPGTWADGQVEGRLRELAARWENRAEGKDA